MFENYFKIVLVTTGALAALVAHVLSKIMPPSLAASLALLIALMWGASKDEVSGKFKTDFDRITEGESDRPTKIIGGWACVCGMLTAHIAAGFWPAAFAAVLGLITIIFAVKFLFKL